jgi:hypothetical protein
MTTIYEKNAASITWRQLYLTLVDFLLAKYFHMRSTHRQLATTRWQFHNNSCVIQAMSTPTGVAVALCNGNLAAVITPCLVNGVCPDNPDFGQFTLCW